MQNRIPFRLMLSHYRRLVNLAWASGGAFVGAYLLRLGFTLPEAIVAYAGIMGSGLWPALRVSRRCGASEAATAWRSARCFARWSSPSC